MPEKAELQLHHHTVPNHVYVLKPLVQYTQDIIARMGIIPLNAERMRLPAGQPAHFQKNWGLLTKVRWVLEMVVGHRITFKSKPTQLHRPCSLQFSQSQNTLILEEVEELQVKGTVVEVQLPPEGGFYSALFLVPKKDGGHRPVINLKALNEYVSAPHFKMEGIHTLKHLLRTGLVGKGGSERCLLLNPDSPRPQKIPVLPTRGQSLPIYLPPLRSCFGTMGLYQDPQTGCSFRTGARDAG